VVSGGGRDIPPKGEAKVWRAATGEAIRTLDGENRIRSVATTAHRTHFALGHGNPIATAEGDISFWSTKQSELPQVLTHSGAHRSPVTGIAFSPDGETLASVSGDSTLKIWNRDLQVPPRSFAATRGLSDVAYSPDGTMVAAGCGDNAVWLWSAKAQAGPRLLQGHQDKVNAVAFSADSERLASASDDKTLTRLSVFGTRNRYKRLVFFADIKGRFHVWRGLLTID
jgi:WD40 repeat protein